MGNLHEGHLSLVHQARPLGDTTVVSIFVNRLQFLPHEDFDSYPRTWDADCAKLQAAGVRRAVCPARGRPLPRAADLQGAPRPAIGRLLEGQFRPGFFTGVATVVMKLFSKRCRPCSSAPRCVR
jgi:pantoate--beta-alanine ligase